MHPKETNVLFDSGAFSAFTQGLKLSLDDYMKFLTDNPWIRLYIVLDDMTSPKISYENYMIMFNNGFEPIPVFHLHNNSDATYLKKYLDKTNFIGLGAIAEASNVTRAMSLDTMFRNYFAPKGYPIVKVHGLGVTSTDLILRYPWFSVDSTTWTKNAAGGRVWLPQIISPGRFYFRGLGDLITVSSRRGSHIYEDKKLVAQIKAYCTAKKLPFNVGKSELVEVQPGYQLQDDEYWIRPNTMGGTGVIERVIERGVTNTMEYRAIVNVCYQYDFLETRFVNDGRFLLRHGFFTENTDTIEMELKFKPLAYDRPLFYFGGIVSKGLKFVQFTKENRDWVKTLESYALTTGNGLQRTKDFCLTEEYQDPRKDNHEN